MADCKHAEIASAFTDKLHRRTLEVAVVIERLELAANFMALGRYADPALIGEFLAYPDFKDLHLADIPEAEDAIRSAVARIEQAASEILDQSDEAPDRLARRIVEDRLHGEALRRYRETEGRQNRSLLRWLESPAVFLEVDRTWRLQRFRETGRYYEGRFVDHPISLSIEDIDCEAFGTVIATALGLADGCSIHVWEDRGEELVRSSINLLVMTGGQNVRVREWKKGKEPAPLNYQPVEEFMISYTPSTGMIEVCAEDSMARRVLGTTFAEKVLDVDLLTRPLSWEVYSLWLFRETLELTVPAALKDSVTAATVIEVAVAAGLGSQTLSAKCGPKDTMRPFARRMLAAVHGLPGAGRIVKVAIHVAYTPAGKARASSFTFALSGKNSSTVKSLRQTERISIATSLLLHWKVLEKYQALSGAEMGVALPQLVRLLDHAPGPADAETIENLVGSIDLLKKANIIVRRGLADVLLLEGEQWFLGDVAMLKQDGSVISVDAERREGPSVPRKIVEQYEIRTDEILHEILSAMPFVKRTGKRLLDTKNLWRVGITRMDGIDVPVWIARNLQQVDICAETDLALRNILDLPQGIVLSTGASPFQCLGPHVVIPIASALNPANRIDPDLLQNEFLAGRALAAAGESIRLLRSGSTLAKLVVPTKGEIVVTGKTRVEALHLLVKAANAGGLSVATGDICGDKMNHPRQLFGSIYWKELHPKFIVSGGQGSWRITR